MEAVVISDGETRVVFRDVRVNDSQDPYAGGSFVIELHAGGLDATRCVFAFGWDGLDAFMTDLAASYQGWEGTKSWTSPERDLHVDAEADHLGHNTLRFTARDGPMPTWRATAETLVAAGEDMTTIADSITQFLSALHAP